MAAAATAVLTVAGGAAALNWPEPQGDSAADNRLPLPYVDGRQVVAGSLRFTIPQGWRAVVAGPGSDCKGLEKTIRIRTEEMGSCSNAPIELYGTSNPNGDTGAMVDSTAGVGGYLRPPVAFTVQGGQPGWSLVREPGQGGDSVVFPWAQVELDLNTEDAVGRQIIDSLRSDPVRSGPLRLPAGPEYAKLTIPDASGTVPPSNDVTIAERAKIEAVLKLLRDQRPVPAGDACTGTARHTARLTLTGPPSSSSTHALPPLSSANASRLALSPAQIAAMMSAPAMSGGFDPSAPASDSPSSAGNPSDLGIPLGPGGEPVTEWPTLQTMDPQFRPTPPIPASTTSVVISLDNGCLQAVSAVGGRVSLDEAAVNELKQLFGIGS